MPSSVQRAHEEDKKELADLLEKATERNTGAQKGTGSGLADPKDLSQALDAAITKDEEREKKEGKEEPIPSGVSEHIPLWQGSNKN